MSIAAVAVNSLEEHGAGLNRPECVVPTLAGDVYVPEWPGGVTVVRPDGTTETWRASSTMDLRPNGVALVNDGSFLIANLGDDGGIWRLQRDGTLRPVLLEVDGVPLPPANFVTSDAQGRLWISVSTRHVPRQRAWRRDVADGFVVLMDRAGARIVADGLHYTNEVRPDPAGEWLYVVETFGRRVRRCRIGAQGALGAFETAFAGDRAFFPDGFAFDDEGGVWVTSLISNRLIRFDGERAQLILEDQNEEFVDEVGRAFAAGSMTKEHLGRIPGTRIQQLTSVAFGGPDQRTVYLGSLHGSCVYRFRTAVSGVITPRWEPLTI